MREVRNSTKELEPSNVATMSTGHTSSTHAAPLKF